MLDVTGQVGVMPCAAVGIGTIDAAHATEHPVMAQDQAGIERTMAAYGAALNGGSTAAVLPLYTEDGVFMAPYGASAVGREAVGNAYDRVFAELKFDVTFTIEEARQVAPDWAFVRTNSVGTMLQHSTGKTMPEANQELFVLHRGGDGPWRIACYSFSPINPPPG